MRAWPYPTLTTVAAALVAISGCGEKKPAGRHGEPDAIAIADPLNLAPGEVRKEPLRGRASSEGPLFERISSGRSGLDFAHRWAPRDESERERISSSFAGGGVALGDVDNDGLPDVFLTRPHGGSRLFRNLGGFRFQDITATVGLDDALADHWSISGTFVDIQGDGYLDLYVCGYDAPNRLFVNDGQGRFHERAAEFGLEFKGASLMMTFADYDRDGDLDAYLLTNRLFGQGRPEKLDFKVQTDGQVAVPEPYRDELGAMLKPDGSLFQYNAGQRDILYRNDGGEFVDASEGAGVSGHHEGLSATWWDYNEDGWIDLYVANDFFGPDRLYRNNKNGTFTDVIADTVPHTPWFSMGSDAGDLNGDGRIDFIASDMAATTHYKQKMNMGDMDEEGWFLEKPFPRQYMRNAVYLNTGTGRFLEVAQMAGLASTDWTWAVKIADFDNDGRNDVFFSNGMTRDFFNSDVRAEVRAIHEKTGENRWSDYPPLEERNRFFQNLGGMAFDDVSEQWGVDEDTTSFGAATGDLDGDGDLDLVVNNFEEPPGLLRNRSSGGELIKVALQGNGNNRHGIGAELRVKGESSDHELVRILHPARGYLGCDPAEAVFGLGEGSFNSLTIRWPSGVEQIVSDLVAGYRYTIAEPDGSPAKPAPPKVPLFGALPTPAKHLESPYDDFAEQPLLPNRLSLEGPAMAWADLDGDGRQDVFLGGGAGHSAQIWIQPGKRRLKRIEQDLLKPSAASEDVDAVFFDADGDSDPDLYVVAGGVESEPGSDALQDRLYINYDGRFIASVDGALPDMRFSGSCVAPGDPDGDGDLDLFVGARVIPGEYPTSARSRLLINLGTGQFTEADAELGPALPTTEMVTDAIWSDADGDGDVDLLVTTEYGPVKLLRNNGGRLADATAEAGLASLLGWWNCIAAADIDGDGDADYAVGNFGLNTKYHPTPKKPQFIYYGDFEGNGTRHIVEAHPDGGSIVPNRGRSCSSGAMPFIAEKFGTFHEFAVSDLAGIYSRPKLESALRLEANELASGILLNDGTGRFEFKPLPFLAQVAPSFGMTFLNANGDTHPDLYVSQNFYGPQRETGRMAGGLGALLFGNGDGTFREVWPEESGIVVPGDARGAEAVDLDGDGRHDIAVAVNSGALQVFLNRIGN